MTRRRLFVGLGTVTVLVSFEAPASAVDVPLFMTEQGRLFDSNSNPVSGSTTFTFRIYGAATGGTYMWQEIEAPSPISLVFQGVPITSRMSWPAPTGRSSRMVPTAVMIPVNMVVP